MSILEFQKPESVAMIGATDSYARFEFRPLEQGYAITIGNALRRILISSLEGFAIAAIRIEGAEHEFAIIPGVMEDVTNIILNLKKVRLKQIVPEVDTETITLTISKKEVFTAKELNSQLTAFEVLNPEEVICHLDQTASIQIELRINKGRGYVPAEENRMENDEINTIAIDSIYTPITNVKYFREPFRVKQKTDYEKLVMEVTTDGSIHPKDAIAGAADILIQHFELFSTDTIVEEKLQEEVTEEFDEETIKLRQLYMTPLTELDLSVRALNCLQSANIQTLGELIAFDKSELLKLRNFGKKSLAELEELLSKMELPFGQEKPAGIN